MAVPSYQSFTERKISFPENSVEISKPDGVLETDLMVAVISIATNIGDITSDGWTLVQQLSTSPISVGVLYKIATSSEPSSYTFNWSSDGLAYAFIMQITGHDTSTPINISSIDIETSATPICPSVITTKDDCLILRIFGAKDHDITLDGGEPAGTTVITVDTNISVSGGAAYESQVTAGATGAAAFALTASKQWIAVSVGIQPESAVSASPSVSPSASISSSASVTPSGSISASVSSSASATPSASVSHTASASPSRTPSASASGTPSASLSVSPSVSVSTSPSTSISSSLSASISTSASRTPSASASRTPSASESASTSGTPSASPSVSPSASMSASVSSSPSASASRTPSASISASVSATPTGSISASPSASPSVSGDELDTTSYGGWTSGGDVQEVENHFVNLDHLEGETVTIQGTDVDDNTTKYDDETVSGGVASLIDGLTYNFVKKAIIGLASKYILRPMRMDVTGRGGTTHGSIKKTAEIVVSLYKSRDVYYGSSLDELHIIPNTDGTEFTGDAVLPFDGGFTLDDPLYISSDSPFPCVIRAIIPRTDKVGR